MIDLICCTMNFAFVENIKPFTYILTKKLSFINYISDDSEQRKKSKLWKLLIPIFIKNFICWRNSYRFKTDRGLVPLFYPSSFNLSLWSCVTSHVSEQMQWYRIIEWLSCCITFLPLFKALLLQTHSRHQSSNHEAMKSFAGYSTM